MIMIVSALRVFVRNAWVVNTCEAWLAFKYFNWPLSEASVSCHPGRLLMLGGRSQNDETAANWFSLSEWRSKSFAKSFSCHVMQVPRPLSRAQPEIGILCLVVGAMCYDYNIYTQNGSCHGSTKSRDIRLRQRSCFELSCMKTISRTISLHALFSVHLRTSPLL